MSEPLSYESAGVDLDRAERFLARIRPLLAGTHGASVVPYTSAFAGLFRVPGGPTLAAACDGVGTKLLVARALGRYRGLGQDLVAMNVNDLLPSGARPLFFLDYVAAGRIDAETLGEVIAGAADACRAAGCALLGGETAEMPDVYGPGDFDLAGFAVGLVDEARLPRLDALQPGDRVLALAASGIHANGLSLARRALTRAGVALTDFVPELDGVVGEILLTPTALYVDPVLAALTAHPGRIRAAAHVTGGGLLGRAAQLARPGCRVALDPSRIPLPSLFAFLGRAGDIPPRELARTFNLGLGFLLVAAPDAAEALLTAPESPWRAVGAIVSGAAGADLGELSCERDDA